MSRWTDQVKASAPFIWWRYNAAPGGIMPDASGNNIAAAAGGNPVNPGNAPGLVDDSDLALDMPNVAENIYAGASGTLAPIRSFGFWARPRGAGTNGYLVGTSNLGNHNLLAQLVSATPDRFRLYYCNAVGGQLQLDSEAGSLVFGELALWSFEFTGTAYEIRKNGRLVGSVTTSVFFDTGGGTFMLGPWSSGSTDGVLDELVVYTAAKGGDFWRAMYAAGAPAETRRAPKLARALHAEVEKPDGRRFMWDANARDPINRPENMSYRTQRGDGFADGSVTLRRRADQDFPDIALLDKLRFVDDSGYVAYEGLIMEFPREVGPDGHSIVVNAAGLMTSARFRKFRELYVDRDISRWAAASAQRKVALAAGSWRGMDPSVITDEATALPGLEQRSDSTAPAAPFIHMIGQYDAGAGLAIGSIYFSGRILAVIGSADAGWVNTVQLATDDTAASTDGSTASPMGATRQGTLAATTATRRFAEVIIRKATAEATTGHSYEWTCLAAYGTSGLAKQGNEDASNAKGFFVSDLIRNICDRFCPMLDSRGVQATTYVVRQAVYRDSTEPFEAFQDLNRFHQWNLSVWEDGWLDFSEPLPLDDWDWEVRFDDPGVEVSLQGDSISGLANGITVVYDDFQGVEQTITPDREPRLADNSPDNPANIAGVPKWIEPPGGKIGFPTTYEDAVQIGIAALREASQVAAPGEITVRGTIYDRNGNPQPVHKVRCDQRIRIANHPNDQPRRIVDTAVSGDQEKTLRISTDNTTKRVEGLFDRIAAAREALGLR